MLKRYSYGEWRPDLAPSDGTLDIAKNVLPSANGYRPAKSFAAITPALPEPFAGGAAYVSSTGETSFLAGTSNKLLRFSGADWAVLLTALSVEAWRFTQYGDLVIAVNGGAPQKYSLLDGTASLLGGDPPPADMVATVRDFVVVAGNPDDRQTVTWSAFNNAEGWTSGTDQSDFQQMLSGGEVTGLAGGEYGIILQRDRIVRMTYTGGDTIFQFDEVASNVGCMSKGSVAQAGKLVFFLSERGFMVTSGAEPTPIGAEKIDRTFFGRYSRDDIKRIKAAVDPRTTTVVWSMPGSPGTVWAYNWTLERWTTVEVGVSGVFTGFTANVSLEALDLLYPGGVDTVPFSLDDLRLAGGNPLLLVANAAGVIGVLNGPNMAATFALARQEPIPGRNARARLARPITDAINGTVFLDSRRRAGDVESVVFSSDVRGNGDVPLRANGRHIEITHVIPAGETWTYATGIDLTVEPAGAR